MFWHARIRQTVGYETDQTREDRRRTDRQTVGRTHDLDRQWADMGGFSWADRWILRMGRLGQVFWDMDGSFALSRRRYDFSDLAYLY